MVELNKADATLGQPEILLGIIPGAANLRLTRFVGARLARHYNVFAMWEHSSLGKVKTVGLPIKFSATPGKVRSGAPLYGQHTAAVLSAYGFGEDEIAELQREGAVAGASFAKDEVS